MINKEALTGQPFSWEKALALAIASQVAYRDEAGVERIAKSLWGFDELRFLSSGDTRGFVCWDERSVLVAFRGTESAGNWLAGHSVHKTVRTRGGGNSLFVEDLFDLTESLLDALQSADAGNKSVHLTGHNTGGSLAMLTAAELTGMLALTGVYTFGQPKSVDEIGARFLNEEHGEYLFRFVNDQDVIARIPPGYVHAGKLIWFDHNGQPRTFESGLGDDEPGLPGSAPAEMTEESFRKLQETVANIEHGVSSLKQEAARTFDVSVEGIIPGVRDHAIAEYIALIRRCRRDQTRLDGLLQQTVQRRFPNVYKRYKTRSMTTPDPESIGPERGGGDASEPSVAGIESIVGSGTTGEQSIPVLLRVRNSNWQAPDDLKIQSRLGTVISASVSAEQLDALQEDSGISSIEASREGGSIELATSKPFVRAHDIHIPPFDERGDAALVGIIDTGIDVLHDAFRDAGGQTDIEFIWNQRDPSGPAPNQVLPGVFHADYGTLYDRNSLQSMVDGNLPVPPALRDPNRHGTHVASIAAGRPAGMFAGGIAPESRLLLVIPAMRFKQGDPPSLGYSTSHVDALGLLRAAAEHLNLPVVVNVSLGMNAGAHDGSSTLEAAFNGFSGGGREPGLVVVKSAGNERGHAGHAMIDVAEGGASSIVWETNDQSRDEDYFEFWFHNFDEIEFTLEDPNNRTIPVPVSKANPAVSEALGGNACHLQLTMGHPDNGDNLLSVRIQRDLSRIQEGTWKMRMVGREIRADGVVHAWVERDAARAVEFVTGDNDEMTLSIPGTAEHVVTVGACASQIPIQLTDSSSFGLTRNDRAKPDLCAPGLDIRAARAGSSNHSATVAMTGTSMAAPHVTGSIALVLSKLEKDPNSLQANSNQIRSALIRSTRNFNGTHHRGFGFGLLDSLDFYNQF